MSETTRRVDEAEPEEPRGPPPEGMVATSHPLAVDAAVDVLRNGGNAVDAAVCAAAVLGVVEPMSTGIGGDCFALCWRPGDRAPVALNGSGRAPVLASIDAAADRGHRSIPETGILPVTVPGALHAWQTLLDARGSRPLSELLAPAVRLAREGFEVAPAVAGSWRASEERLREGVGTEPFLGRGRAPAEGDRHTLPELSDTLARVAADGIDAFYSGPIAQAIEHVSDRLGGWIRLRDLERHESEWVEPLEGVYRGHPVYAPPPNGQGIVALEALGILDGFPLGDADETLRHHYMIEAIKLAFADALAHVGDPEAMRTPAGAWLHEAYLESRRDLVGSEALAAATPGVASDTVHVSAVDADGGCCSLINSLYMPFGACVVPEGTGVLLQNRGALFRLEAGHPSALGPRRRPYHTIVPTLTFRQGRPWLVLGVGGGFQQPQGIVQIVSGLLDRLLEPEAAVAAPRFRWLDGARVRLEPGIDPDVDAGLARRGHAVVEGPAYGGFGGAQLIRIDPDRGTLAGASDPRKDGTVGRTDG